MTSLHYLQLIRLARVLTIVLATSVANAFPVLVNFTEDSRSFGLGFTAAVNGGGCFSGDETRRANYGVNWWRVTLAVTEDDCGDDEVKVVGTAQHRSSFPGDPEGPVFNFAFDLTNSNDASHFRQGNHALPQLNQTFAHLFPHNFTFEYDIFQANFNFHIDEGFVNNDIDRYTFSLTGHAVNSPGTLSLAVFGLLMGILPLWRRQLAT